MGVYCEWVILSAGMAFCQKKKKNAVIPGNGGRGKENLLLVSKDNRYGERRLADNASPGKTCVIFSALGKRLRQQDSFFPVLLMIIVTMGVYVSIPKGLALSHRQM